MNKNKMAGQERLWSFNYFLLWQGQMVSVLGDALYELALGFWILSETGSPAMMGTLLAASTLPRVLISPFAGVIVDRVDRKKLLVLMDLIRGIFVIFVGIAAYLGFIQVWMVFAAGIILGICAAFFNPTTNSILPDIVPKSTLVQANSYLGMARTGTEFAGYSMGGILLKALGAPTMFLTNGISYLFSAFTEIFIKVPKTDRQEQQFHFWADMKEGVTFVKGFKGLRNLIFIAAVINFFCRIATVAIVPLFNNNPDLGKSKYGLALGALLGGMFIGMISTSIVNFKAESKFKLLMTSGILSSICFAIFPYFKNFAVMLLILVVTGVFNAILNVMINVSVQLTVPKSMRGKIFALMTVTSSLSPIAMILSGVLAEFVFEQYIITASFTIVLVLFIPFLFMPSFRQFINYNPDKQELSEIA